mmetsp:Transcript_1973/g.8674  ORF Transcript_1973/g.8674 Transcript_1973/m.8674 type:complete len:240 (+) Transcript_1973:137-856(+)
MRGERAPVESYQRCARLRRLRRTRASPQAVRRAPRRHPPRVIARGRRRGERSDQRAGVQQGQPLPRHRRRRRRGGHLGPQAQVEAQDPVRARRRGQRRRLLARRSARGVWWRFGLGAPALARLGPRGGRDARRIRRPGRRRRHHQPALLPAPAADARELVDGRARPAVGHRDTSAGSKLAGVGGRVAVLAGVLLADRVRPRRRRVRRRAGDLARRQRPGRVQGRRVHRARRRGEVPVVA